MLCAASCQLPGWLVSFAACFHSAPARFTRVTVPICKALLTSVFLLDCIDGSICAALTAAPCFSGYLHAWCGRFSCLLCSVHCTQRSHSRVKRVLVWCLKCRLVVSQNDKLC
jgi:hypothetical protein